MTSRTASNTIGRPSCEIGLKVAFNPFVLIAGSDQYRIHLLRPAVLDRFEIIVPLQQAIVAGVGRQQIRQRYADQVHAMVTEFARGFAVRFDDPRAE